MAVNVVQFREFMRPLGAGSRITLTYGRENAVDVMYLIPAFGRYIKGDRGTELLLMTVMMSQDWERDSNRTFTIELLDEAKSDAGEAWFMGRVVRALDNYRLSA